MRFLHLFSFRPLLAPFFRLRVKQGVSLLAYLLDGRRLSHDVGNPLCRATAHIELFGQVRRMKRIRQLNVAE